MKKLLLTMFLFIFLIGMVSSIETFKQSEDALIELPVYENDFSQCTACTCTISVKDPLDNLIVDEQAMSISSNRISYNVSGGNHSTLGTYDYDIFCTNGADNGAGEGNYQVTYDGNELNTQRSLLYLGLIAILIFLLLVVAFNIPNLPKGDVRSEDGILLQINHLKYLRPLFYAISWLLLLGIMFISSNIAIAYLPTSLFGDTLFVIWRIMMLMTYPMIIIWFMWIFYRIFQDREMKNMLERGIQLGGSGF